MTIATEFERAFRLHQQGKLREAFLRYDAVLAADPKHAAALHYSGVVLYQAGKVPEAAQRIRAALTLDPASADAWSNLALVESVLVMPNIMPSCVSVGESARDCSVGARRLLSATCCNACRKWTTARNHDPSCADRGCGFQSMRKSRRTSQSACQRRGNPARGSITMKQA